MLSDLHAARDELRRRVDSPLPLRTLVRRIVWVAPIDKLSLPLTVLLAVIFLREPVSWQLVGGVALMVTGALLTRL